MSSPARCVFLLLALLIGGASLHAEKAANAPGNTIIPSRLIASARAQVGVTKQYDPEYHVLEYPGGDVPREIGVCTDVVIRALREQGSDLQALVHEDMMRNFRLYPQAWGLRKPDKNIDHRRVLNLMTYFKRQGCAVPITDDPAGYQPGDIVMWNLAENLPHTGIISDRKTDSGTPLVLHNIGAGTQEEDALFTHKIIGHFRLTKLGG
jgi:uncharacterized protein YijF (DUF1287 family)